MNLRTAFVAQQKRDQKKTKAKSLLKAVNTGLVLFTSGAVLSQVQPDVATDRVQAQGNVSKSQFLGMISDYARDIAAENDLYASVMIAQAALESGWGNSTLAQAPNYNLFGIKGSYNGQSVNKPTLEDDGSGRYYQINDSFRRYNNYGESLQDYANLLTGNNDPNNWRYNFYAGARRSNAPSYQDATAHLTGRYATDTQYGTKLNRIIAENNLTQYDVGGVSRPVPNTTSNTPASTSNQAAGGSRPYTVQSGDTLYSIARRNGLNVNDLIQANGGTSFIRAGQTINLGGVSQPAVNTASTASQTTANKPVPNTATRSSRPAPSNKPVANTTRKPSAASPASQTSANRPYKIQRGDTLYSIARRNGMNVYDLIAANGGTSFIRAGETIDLSKVKPGAGAELTASGARPYTIQRGDTLYSIARRNGLNVNDLVAANGGTSFIRAGDTINLGGNTTPAPANTQVASASNQAAGTSVSEPYSVQRGDTLYSIAKRNNLNVYDLIEANGGTSLIRVGQQLDLGQFKQPAPAEAQAQVLPAQAEQVDPVKPEEANAQATEANETEVEVPATNAVQGDTTEVYALEVAEPTAEGSTVKETNVKETNVVKTNVVETRMLETDVADPNEADATLTDVNNPEAGEASAVPTAVKDTNVKETNVVDTNITETSIVEATLANPNETDEDLADMNNSEAVAPVATPAPAPTNVKETNVKETNVMETKVVETNIVETNPGEANVTAPSEDEAEVPTPDVPTPEAELPGEEVVNDSAEVIDLQAGEAEENPAEDVLEGEVPTDDAEAPVSL